MSVKITLLVFVLILGGYSCAVRKPVLLPQPIIQYGCEAGWTLAGKSCYIHLSAEDAKMVNTPIGAVGDVSIFSEEPGTVVCKKSATVRRESPAVRHIAPGQVPQAMRK